MHPNTKILAITIGGVVAGVAVIVVVLVIVIRKVMMRAKVKMTVAHKIGLNLNDKRVHKLRIINGSFPKFDGASFSVTPTEFGMKFIAAYMAEDVDPITQSNIGTTAMIYINPECNGNIGQCNISATTSEGTFANVVTTFFDFAQPTADVNAQINAQIKTIPSGTYRYLRLEFCKYGLADDATTMPHNIKFQAGDMTAPHEFSLPQCTVTVEADSPMILNPGDTVEINLAYSLLNTVAVFPPPAISSPFCSVGPAGNTYCLSLPNFAPTAIITSGL